eukprot:TRINITY_DN61360_c0_g1_i1.p1 TRINITY_DN61360_c0_g1~~TRINITY_DN61360_c0_g1_i1.p1  ORF type:complete len:224 (-),score=23.74 TRINITY_DN61360_c0_g1_i1:348-1019(-)
MPDARTCGCADTGLVSDGYVCTCSPDQQSCDANQVESCTGRWDPAKAPSDSTVSADGTVWTQPISDGRITNGHPEDVRRFQGIAAARGVCGSCDTKKRHSWVVKINRGSYHQIGIAQAGWDGKDSLKDGPEEKFAFVYSSLTGWNRHRGAAEGHGQWDDTWDYTKMGDKFIVQLDCTQHTFRVKTSSGKALATFTYPKGWTEVFPAVAGQTSDHEYAWCGCKL